MEAKLWTASGFSDNVWQRAETAEAVDGAERVILPLAVFLDLDPGIRDAAIARMGVEVLPGEGIDPLLPFLDRLPLVALAFPVFNDGRSYSKAELLRSRYGFRGEIRATGDVLIDQISHMLRCGFTSLEVTNPVALARLEAGRTGGIPLHYQPSAATPGARGSYAWRRTAQPSVSE